MKTHRELYTKLYRKKENYDVILNALVTFLTSLTLFEKWTHYSETGHLIANSYDRVCIDLTQYSLLETFFPLWSKPPQNSSECIMHIKKYFL